MSVKGREELEQTLSRTERQLRELSSEVGHARAAVLDVLSESPGTTVAELADRFGVSEKALVAFLESARDVLGDRELTVAAARRAGLLATAGGAWENEVGPLLTSAQVRELLGDVSRQRVDELLRARRLVGLRDSGGRRRFPTFQFRDGRPLEPLIAAYWTVADATVSAWTAASWCAAPDDALDGRSPAQWAHEGGDPARLASVAREDAARFAQ